MDYEKALEKARAAYGTGAYDDATLEFIFPQIKESEEEKRKRAVAVLEQQRYYWAYDGPADKTPPATKRKDLVEAIDVALSYLEKPSIVDVLTRAGLRPFKDGNKWCILAGDNIQEGICGFGDTIEEALYEFLIDVIDMQKEQKPAELEQLAKLREMTHEIREAYERGIEVGRAESKQEWSEEDEKMLVGIIERGSAQIPPHEPALREEQIEWLMNRLKSLRPQPKQEWGEEDENKRTDAIYFLKCSESHYVYPENISKIEAIIDWLKSLRPSCKPGDGPVWRIWKNGACGTPEGNPIALVKESCGYKLVSYLCADGEKYIMLSDLEKLPGFNEK